jgi:uncharacterized membrane protein
MSQESNGSNQGGVIGKLVDGVESLVKAATDRAMSILQDRMGDITDKLTDYATGGGGAGKAAISKGMQSLQEGRSPVGAAAGAIGAGGKEQVKQVFGGGGGGGGDDGDSDNQRKTDLKVTNIVESIDVGVPVWLAYNQWTQFKDFPSFMKKVENVEQESEEKLLWQAQILFSHRKWESTIIEQVPDERIVWQSKGDKGSVDGTVSFHELTPDLTRILVVLEYHPKGFVEKTGNIWRAPGRRVRLELKHFVRQCMTQSLLNPDEIKGWRGEIRDGEVVDSGESNQGGEGDHDQRQRERAQQNRGRSEQGGPDQEGEQGQQDQGQQDQGQQDQAERQQADGQAPEKSKSGAKS